MEVPAQMRPAGRLPELRNAISAWGIELAITLITISLKDAAGMAQVSKDMLLFPVGSEFVSRTRWRLTSPRSLVENVGPYPPLPDAFA